MPIYKAPLKDMRFVFKDLLQSQQKLLPLPDFSDFNQDLIDVILESAAKFCENELFPLNQIADQQSCHLSNNTVKTPDGFIQAYQNFVANGWPALAASPQYGGQGLPKTVQLMVEEMVCSSNIAFSLYNCLTSGVYLGLLKHADPALKNQYLPKLATGEWTGTMCLTESHCGSDLGLIRSKAIPGNNDSYKITGTKIFITSGEHELAENIIHLVLARLPDAPAGVKGISLFLVPKFLVNADNSLAQRNNVYCTSLEHKMGIKGSATCVMNFEDATGFLVGEAHHGLRAMFTVMNIERVNIGLEGLALAETAYQNAVQYAQQRQQGQANGVKQQTPAPIIVHPDVRRMLLTMKAFIEGARAFAAWTGLHIDIANHHPDQNTRMQATELVALMTPVIKAYFTDMGFNACNLGLQVFGGHGYIAETGMEQYVRDARIAQIYEGTNGIQALDLLRRKIVADQGKALEQFADIMQTFINEQNNNKLLQPLLTPCQQALARLKQCTHWILDNANNDANLIGAAATDYLKLFALTILAYFWAQMAAIAYEKLAEDKDFYQAKIHAAEFFMQRMLPETISLEQCIYSGSDNLMVMDAGMF